MDLLGGYGSSSSSTSSSDENEGDGDDNKKAMSEATLTLTQTRTRTRTATTAGPSAAGGRSNSKNSKINQKNQEVIRGKKILSLASVLPPHIVQRLERSMQRGEDGINEDDLDEDEDQEDESGRNINCRIKAAQDENYDSTHKRPPAAATKDETISQLLLDLSAAPAVATAAIASAADLTSRITNDGKRNRQSQHQPLGQAFVTATATTTTVSRKSRKGSIIIDIHAAPNASASGSCKATSERSDDFSPLPFSGLTKAGSLGKPESMPPSSVQPPLPPPLPCSATLSLRVSAAPEVRSTGPSPANPDPLLAPPTTRQETRPPGVLDHTHEQPNVGSDVQAKGKKKRSRQQLERALRHGNLAAIQQLQSEADVRTIHRSDPAENPYHSPQEDGPSQYASTGTVRVGPAPMYDPATGMIRAASGAAGSGGERDAGGQGRMTLKGRGKNQIHHVVAAAAQLEMQRARQQQHLPASAGRGSSGNAHRANAKAKYGW